MEQQHVPGRDPLSGTPERRAPSTIRPDGVDILAWTEREWNDALTRVRRDGRAYVWLNLVEQRLRAVVGAVLRPIYEPVHGDDWVVAAAGPGGAEWADRAAAVREVSRRKGYLLDPADDDLLVFLTLPQLRELIAGHWPCFAPFLDDRRELELALDELEVARHVVARNRSLTSTVLAQAERTALRLLQVLGGNRRADDEAAEAPRRMPVDVIEDLVADRYADVIGVHPDRVRLQRELPMEELLRGARTLDAVGIALNPLVQNFTARRLARLALDGCRMRLLFINPASSTVRRRERELGLSRGELARTVEANIIQMRRVRARVADPAVGRAAEDFQIRVFDETPRFTAYLVDGDGPDGLAVIQPYLRRARGTEAPALVVRGRGGERGAEPGVFDLYREEFEGAWEASRPVS
ncbi:SAV2148 family HEPN domain-containing protein [Allostreptomyces psammosilenae]|nr:SAV2148 family HEPN domain-containing protein [Allostreptomyces psammosilenae]